MQKIETENYKRFEIEYWYDEYSESPREWDNVGKMICFHNRYTLGDKHNYSSPDDLMDFLNDNKNEIVYLPIYAYEHGNITISTKPYSCQWDSGQVGVIYAYRDELKKRGYKTDDEIEYVLNQEVKTFDDYCRGECYGFTLYDDSGEVLESVGGFLGDIEYCKNESIITANYYDNKLPMQYELNFA